LILIPSVPFSKIEERDFREGDACIAIIHPGLTQKKVILSKKRCVFWRGAGGEDLVPGDL
jgi:hypothetical protein